MNEHNDPDRMPPPVELASFWHFVQTFRRIPIRDADPKSLRVHPSSMIVNFSLSQRSSPEGHRVRTHIRYWIAQSYGYYGDAVHADG